ncbi:MAG: Ig-like domain-containing protein [Bifidobacteriaceae bacterium]|jgi:uncharacterized protein YkwD|nr:Ig-like domain-containing protein [Bifidobacteriaceae bacterium]
MSSIPRILFASLTSSALFLTGVTGLTAPAAAARHGTTINTSSQAAVRQAYQEWYLPPRAVPAGWTGSNASCNPGTNSAASRAAQLETINFFRAMAGLGMATENASATAAGQAAALMMSKNNDLEHYPPVTWGCYTSLGAQAAAAANIAWSSAPETGANTITRYVDDRDTASVGHRLWVLYPGQTKFGLGLTANTSAMVWGLGADSGRNGRPNIAVPWPSAGYFPSELLPSSRYWSYSGQILAAVGKTVSVTLNGRPLSGVSVVTAKNGSANRKPDGVLVWRMPALRAPAAGAVDVYNVAISGIASYQVKVFQASLPGSAADVGARDGAVGGLRMPVKTVYVKAKKTVKIPILADGLDAGDAESVTWKSGKKTVATVTSSGKKAAAAGKGSLTAKGSSALSVKVKALKRGSATIVFKANGHRVKLKVKVVRETAKAKSVAVKGGAKRLAVGATGVLQVGLKPAKATGAVPKWKSSNRSVLTVDAAGKVTARAPGRAVVTAKVGAKTAKRTITVR